METIFLYDDWKPIAEWDGWTEDYFQAWNVYGPGADEILLRHEAKMGYIRYHSDPHGNVKFLLDNDGRVVEKYTYDVFGRPKIMGPGGEERASCHYNNRFLFQSQGARGSELTIDTSESIFPRWAAGFSAVYDAANRMVAVSNSGMALNAEVELVYDGLGRCVKRTIQGTIKG